MFPCVHVWLYKLHTSRSGWTANSISLPPVSSPFNNEYFSPVYRACGNKNNIYAVALHWIWGFHCWPHKGGRQKNTRLLVTQSVKWEAAKEIASHHSFGAAHRLLQFKIPENQLTRKTRRCLLFLSLSALLIYISSLEWEINRAREQLTPRRVLGRGIDFRGTLSCSRLHRRNHVHIASLIYGSETSDPGHRLVKCKDYSIVVRRRLKASANLTYGFILHAFGQKHNFLHAKLSL